MKRFLLFSGKNNSPTKYLGWMSYVDSYDTEDEAKEIWKFLMHDWGQIVDTELEVIVKYGFVV